MIADFESYRMAKRISDQYGPEAAAYAYGMMRRFMAKNDGEQAGDWLAIAVAIENLQKLPPADTPHE
jgi:hypothetical protein